MMHHTLYNPPQASRYETSVQLGHHHRHGFLDSDPKLPVLPAPHLPACPPPLPKYGIPAGLRGDYASVSMPAHKTRLHRPGNEDVLATFASGISDADKRKLEAPSSSTQSTIGNGRFDDDVMAVYERGKQRERELEAQRQALLDAPLQQTMPAHILSTHVHADLLGVSRQHYDKPKTIYTEGSSSVASQADRFATKKRIMAVEDDLQARRKPKQAPFLDVSTMKAHFQPVDTVAVESMNGRTATVPVPHREFAEALPHVELPTERKLGDLETTYGREMIPRSADSSDDRKHHIRGTFDKKRGVCLISHRSFHPRETGAAPASTTDVVPNHFLSTSASHYTLDVKKLP